MYGTKEGSGNSAPPILSPVPSASQECGRARNAKRRRIFEPPEMRSILSQLAVREMALVSTDMITGLRRGELAGLKWKDIDFANLLIKVSRSLVDQRTGKCKTEASAKP